MWSVKVSNISWQEKTKKFNQSLGIAHIKESKKSRISNYQHVAIKFVLKFKNKSKLCVPTIDPANCRVLGPSHDGNHPWKLTSQSDFPLLTYLGLCAKSCVSHIPASGGSNPSPLFGLSISSLSSMCLVQRSTSQFRGYDHSIIGLGYTRAWWLTSSGPCFDIMG